MKQFVGLKANRYWHLRDKNDEKKKEKGRKKCVIKNLNLKNIKTV